MTKTQRKPRPTAISFTVKITDKQHRAISKATDKRFPMTAGEIELELREIIYFGLLEISKESPHDRE